MTKPSLSIAFIIGFFLSLPISRAADAPGPRQRLLMDFGWRFTFKDPPDAQQNLFDYPEVTRVKAAATDADREAQLAANRVDPVATNLGAAVSYVRPGFDDTSWRQLDLPHDWAIEVPFDQGGQEDHGFKALGARWGTNIGWYRRSFDLPADDEGKALSLEFDGVYRNCLVWLNGHCLGRNVSGYSSFSYDIAKQANFGGKNTLVVRVDASQMEGWFYEGAGIYRHVWLVKTAPAHISHWGTFVTSEVDGTSSKTSIQTDLQNDYDQPRTVSLSSEIFDSAGKSVGQINTDGISLDPGKGQTVTQKITFANANLWSLENPYLYRVESTVKSQDAATDRYETNFGVRTLKFDADKGFFLNGKHVVIQGVCNHQDHAGVGSAMPDRVMEFRIEKLKEMGVNAYRMSHNPPAPELLDACDRLGMLVLDEHRKMGTTPEILDQLGRMVRRDRNHPSIFMWSIGNEESAIEGRDVGIPICQTMQDLVHKLDPTRLCTVAMNLGWEQGFSKVIDVQGFNYYRVNNMDRFHQNFPTKPAIGTEEASTITTRGEYARNNDERFLAAYDDYIPRWGSRAEQWLPYYAARPWAIGAFVWTGFDYRGEPTPFHWPDVESQFGLMDACGFPKDIYYYYQANWTDKPMVHLFPHWNWAGKEGQNIDVWCYSNMDDVELFLNGKSLGKKKVDRMQHEAWTVPYQPGELMVSAHKAGTFQPNQTTQPAKIPTDQLPLVIKQYLNTTGAPTAIKLIPDRDKIKGDGEDVSIITVQALDDQGRAVPTANNEISFDIEGGKIIGVGNGNPTSLESDKGNKRKLFNGLAQVIVQSLKTAGPIVLTATGDGLKPMTVTIMADGSGPRPAAP